VACVLAVPSAVAAVPARSASATLVSDPTDYVNPFIGTKKGVDWENTFPGATAPFGMVQFSPDTTSGPTGYSYTDDAIKGFSLTHFSGGCSSFGDIPILPVTGEIGSNPAARTEHFSHDDEHAAPGSYSARLTDSNVQVDLGATERTGVASFRYPAGSQAQAPASAVTWPPTSRS
jgi:putative alpha-1,2-mannosidase